MASYAIIAYEYQRERCFRVDIRTMQYFLAVVREGTISAAAESLHVAQPSLSRQMKELEAELGTSLFIRGNRQIALTDEGMVLRRRAEEMVQLMQLTEDEISRVKNRLTGSVHIGAGESRAFRYLARTAGSLIRDYPDIRIHITSGDTEDLTDELDNGLIDFAVIFTDVDYSKYRAIQLPPEDRFGVLMPKTCELAQKDEVTPKDLADIPLITSRASLQQMESSEELRNLRIIGSYNLINNASLMVEEEACFVLGFDGLINTTGNSGLCFRPLKGQKKTAGAIIWKKYQSFSPAVQLFIDRMKEWL